MYSEKVMEHFININPRNVGEISDASGMREEGDEICGDFIRLFIKVEDNILSELKFKAFGCAAAIATGSMTTELAGGKTLDEGLKLTPEEVAEALGGLPPHKMDCSNLTVKALHEAIENYLENYRAKSVDDA